ncbi:MAG TPA: hypothetical protein VD902_01120 [Symbiobacteriaceae bacterium]|nr:hypothetical protein [Symbiobacteriaceae bacterium]
MDLIIPGVQILVVRELVPRPLGATGILGIVGCTEVDQSKGILKSLGSLQEFRAEFGPGSVHAIPEVAQAFAAGLNQVVVANIPPDKAVPAAATAMVKVVGMERPVLFTARAGGAWGNRIRIRLVYKAGPAGTGDGTVEAHVFYGEAKKPVEMLRNLSPKVADERYFIKAIQNESSLITTAWDEAEVTAKVLPVNTDPNAAEIALAGGEDPAPGAFVAALARLEAFGEVDMVAASHLYGEMEGAEIYAQVLSHCERMSKMARPRVGFGQAPPPAEPGGKPNVPQACTMAQRLASDRFVMVAPFGYMGAVIGMIAGLPYFESPTFKRLGGVSALSFDFTDTNLMALIQGGVCAVDEVPRKGIACVKGITTDTSQISVTRVADRAVRHVQNIAQDFIGLLNTEAQRLALKQRITEAFARMEREGALVPSTDGKSPAFVVNVECLPDDFAAGRVRVDIAIRPVRAIDYIYATIKVQAF